MVGAAVDLLHLKACACLHGSSRQADRSLISPPLCSSCAASCFAWSVQPGEDGGPLPELSPPHCVCVCLSVCVCISVCA